MLKQLFDFKKLKQALPTFNSIQPCRTTYILKRKYPVRLHKKNHAPRKLRSGNYIYELVEDTDSSRQPDLEVILTTYVEGLGDKGDRVFVRPRKAYEKLLLPGLAVYPSPNNIKRYCDESIQKDERQYSSPFVQRTMNFLSELSLGVLMNKENQWTIEPWHVRVAFRHLGIIIPEEAISLPENTISGPDLGKENKVFYVTVTINNKETVPVKCRIHHWSTKPEERLPPLPAYWEINEKL